MSDDRLPTICGIFCGTCKYLGNGCEGCSNVKGKPFWTELIGIGTCPIYDCCVNTRHLGHCGECSELLCGRYTQIKDPAIPDQQLVVRTPLKPQLYRYLPHNKKSIF